MSLKTVEEANYELEIALQEAVEDNPDISKDEIWFDMMVATVYNIENDAVAREFCRRQCGSIPQEHEARLGKADWLRL